ncbi:protein of unknown function [Pseudomonas sp. JV241A]|nr:protein of unknown function [Pseudomonas sp. JV241A]
MARRSGSRITDGTLKPPPRPVHIPTPTQRKTESAPAHLTVKRVGSRRTRLNYLSSLEASSHTRLDFPLGLPVQLQPQGAMHINGKDVDIN